MPTATIKYRGTRAEFMAALRTIAAVLAGREADPTGQVVGIQHEMGKALMGELFESYKVRSVGVIDDTNIIWPILSPVTIKKKGHDTILVDEGKTLGSLDPDNPTSDTIFRIGPGFVEVGSDRQTKDGLSILALHKHGTAKMPARPVLPEIVPDSWYDAMRAAMMKSLADRPFWLAFFGSKAA